MKLVHVNLAKGFGGGERQTALLIKALSNYNELQQILVCRKDSPLRKLLAEVIGLEFIKANHQLSGHSLIKDADIVHAHDAKGVHWACWHYFTKRTPYIITRRVNSPVRKKASNQWCYCHAARRVAISYSIKKGLSARKWGEVDLIADAYSGFSFSKKISQSFRNEFSGKFLVGHAGALVDRTKGQRILLEAARLVETEYPDIHFVFFGEGKDAAILQKESVDQKNVTWMGFKENIGDYLAGLDVFAFPSRNEGLGSVLLDVMDAGVPIIASNVGGIPDIVKHGETGLLFDKENVSSLINELEKLYFSLSMRNKLKKEARVILKHYSAEVAAKKYYDVYLSVLV
ncbi:glycosyltransferase family 4 protein [Vreelandella rituensis]|uniref:Glycosyltransferase family 1 protein n=1 Tax=Vreelandella rituensis TaxID=2282306 RepID=A0A368U6E7_9GAMM|nr:glycosyltransferase family 4 protein [Halomonas rituensis]RCV92451.1 glycosyltransferase family 1 protein [Halomonas rituensis]